MPGAIPTTDVLCPQCGASQREPRGAISTFCRTCGAHFEIGRPAPAPRPVLRRARTGTTVHCYKCGGTHEVSRFAKSTICPHCGSGIEMTDLVFAANASRPVDIRGTLVVRAGVNINNSWIICSNAEIAGTVTGTLFCEEELVFKGKGKLSFRACAGATRVERGADIELGYPLVTRSLVLRGRLSGRVVCSGRIHIRRGASMSGSIETRSLVVDRGAGWCGPTLVGPEAGHSQEALFPSGVFSPPPLS
jgi:ssDNA-binding Zn-finger/Zn-ribbon topoisomerase 1